MSNLHAMLKEHNTYNKQKDLAMGQFQLEVGRLSRGVTEEPDVFEKLLMATDTIKNPIRKVQVTGVRNTTCIRGLKRTVLICADGVDRVITYRGKLTDAVPSSTITLVDISEDME